MRKLLFTLIALLLLGGSAQAKRELTRAERDSVVNALATIWGKYLKDKADKSTDKADNAEYMRGLTDALNLSHQNSSYYLGLQDGIIIDSRLMQVEQMGGFDVDRAKLAIAFERAAKGRGSKFTPETADRYMNYIMTAMAADEAVLNDSKAFLDSIARKEGIRKSDTGMLFEIIQEGEGDQPNFTVKNFIDVTYVGRLYDGTVFDGTHAEKPVTFDLTTLIPGFAEGIYHMRPGGTYRIYMPASIAYGETGIPGVIPPNAALQFDVTLLKVTPEQSVVQKNE